MTSPRSWDQELVHVGIRLKARLDAANAGCLSAIVHTYLTVVEHQHLHSKTPDLPQVSLGSITEIDFTFGGEADIPDVICFKHENSVDAVREYCVSNSSTS